MDWSTYKDKKGKTAEFTNKEVVTREAVKEVKDSDGTVVKAAQTEEKRTFISMNEKAWDSTTGEKLADREKEFSLSELEREKKRYDDDMTRAKAYSDGLKLAIQDFKKL